MKNVLLLLVFAGLSELLPAQSYVEYYRQGMEAYKKGDYILFLSSFEKADSARPNHRGLLYNLAVGYALNHQPEKAYSTLEYRAKFYAVNDFREDPDLSILSEGGYLGKIDSFIVSLNEQHQESDLAFEVAKEGLHAEGITYNSKTAQFLLSDIRNGWIYRVDKDGENPVLLIDLKESGFWSAMGMGIDSQSPNVLWVTTSAMPNFAGFTDSLDGKAAVLKFDLNSGSLLQSYTVPGNHVFGDMIIAKDGTVYVTDSLEPVIYRINPVEAVMEEYLRNPDWWNLQGMALSKDQKNLYISDYIIGIYKIDVASKRVLPLVEENEWLRGSDGIYLYEDKLLMLQNGTFPIRIAEISLGKDGLGIPATLHFPDNALPVLDEPTLGVMVGPDVYFIANSPWGHYDEQMQPLLEEWLPLQIHRISLK